MPSLPLPVNAAAAERHKDNNALAVRGGARCTVAMLDSSAKTPCVEFY